MSVTIRDVARHAGVSVATASRALSGSRNVRPELAARVTEAARTLCYRHNTVAQALRRGRTNTVGMVVPEIGNPFFPAIVEALERRLEERGMDLILCDAQQDIDIERRRVLTLVGRQVDGLIIVPVSATDSRATLLEAQRSIPVVQVDRFADDLSADWVGVDDEVGIAQAIDHVASLGAVRCVFVSAKPRTSSAQQRLTGFERAVHRAGLDSPAPLLDEFSVDWGRRAALELIARGKRLPDAVICGNDVIAFGVLSEFRRHHVRVPEDVLVTGFDDIRFAELADPPLTTVRQPRDRMAAECLRLLDIRIADPDAPTQRIAISPTLVIRESTGGHS